MTRCATRRRRPRLALALALAVVAGLAPWVGTSWAGWAPANTNTANTFTTAASWESPMVVWGQDGWGQTGVLLPSISAKSSVRMPGLEHWAAVAAGDDSTCALTTAGALSCWGSNSYGQLGTGDTTNYREPVAVAVGTTWSRVAKGYINTCAIKASDSTLWCWGYNADGQVGDGTSGAAVHVPTQVTTSGLSTWSSVTLGQYYACGLKTDSSLWCWGYNGNGRLGVGDTARRTVPTQVGTSSWSSVSAGWWGACGITSADSALRCWGSGGLGQLGNGSNVDQPAPVPVSGGGAWSQAAPGDDHACGLKTDGTIWCWGFGGTGDLGNNATADSWVPVQESTASTSWTRLTTGMYFSCAQKVGGALFCWGQNHLGQLGDGTNLDRDEPQPSGSATDWTVLSGGSDYFCGIRGDAAIWCQGYDVWGELGQDFDVRVGSPTPLLPPATGWLAGSIGYEGGCGVRDDSTLWCWGFNSQGQTGTGDTSEHSYPAQAGVATTWSAVSVGTWTACGLQSDDSLWCWGMGLYGQLGTVDTTAKHVPTAGPAGSWSSVSVGETHACGLLTSGALYCWGDGSNGQLGQGTTSDHDTPQLVSVSGITSWTSVSAGYFGTCAIAATADHAGELYCWGDNLHDQVGDGSGLDQKSPVRIGTGTWSTVEVGREHVCGVQTAGSLWCWGLNSYGQIGVGGTPNSPTSYATPQQVGAATTWTHVAPGWDYSCARRSDSTVWCWGRDDYGQLGDRGSATVTSPQQVPGLSASWVHAHTSTRATLALS